MHFANCCVDAWFRVAPMSGQALTCVGSGSATAGIPGQGWGRDKGFDETHGPHKRSLCKRPLAPRAAEQRPTAPAIIETATPPR
jgi:hypothetical protein